MNVSPQADLSRASVTIIVSVIQGRQAFHFCSIPLLQGVNHDLWWPLPEGEHLHRAVEAVMTLNRVAHNVTRIDFLRENGGSTDYTVIFNRGEMCELNTQSHKSHSKTNCH